MDAGGGGGGGGGVYSESYTQEEKVLVVEELAKRCDTKRDRAQGSGARLRPSHVDVDCINRCSITSGKCLGHVFIT